METRKTMAPHSHCGCSCFIIPVKVLRKLARDSKLPAKTRQALADTVKFEAEWRKARDVKSEVSLSAQTILPNGLTAAPVAPPAVTVFNCGHGTSLPGVLIPNPGASSDPTCKRAFNETKAVAKFYKSAFGRNSIDNAGMALISSIHFSVNYNNAFWNGNQMTYGDGDGHIFIDFTKGNDVIGHELTHGVTQHTLGLAYQNQPGGLNESISDVFGSMFRQWEAGQSVTNADWLIGKDIMGPAATAQGYTCLRDLSNPAASHCLSKQPTKFSQYHDGMDPHESSGIPNFAFYKAAMAIGGKSWTIAGKIWYKAVTGYGHSPNMTMKQFANRTRTVAGSLFPLRPAVKVAVDKAWKAVGL
ncbi:MAG: M4 family metallopeptidase [Chitinophagaceae bacterium]